MLRTIITAVVFLASCAPNPKTAQVHIACARQGIPCFELRGADRVKLIDANQYRNGLDRLAGPQYQLHISPDDCAEDSPECVRLVQEFASCLRGERACPRTGLILW